MKLKLMRGRVTCLTAWDAKGRAHLRDPFVWSRTVCGRELDKGGVRGVKTCFACAEGAAEANRRLRKES